MQIMGSGSIYFLCLRLPFGIKVRWTPITEKISAGETIEIYFRPERIATIS